MVLGNDAGEDGEALLSHTQYEKYTGYADNWRTRGVSYFYCLFSNFYIYFNYSNAATSHSLSLLVHSIHLV